MSRIARGAFAAAAIALLAFAGAHAQAAGKGDPEREQTRRLNEQQLRETQDAAPVYGSQLMSPEERRQHRDRMRSAKTAEEREQIRREHHAQMQARAKERGVTLPDEPPMMGGGRGMGMGQGMGHGMGRGPMGGSPGSGSTTTPQK
jgi:hypothetical protein